MSRSLHALWQEWEVGGKGQKPVRLWNATERGKHKATLYKRNFLRTSVSEMMLAGHSSAADAACDMIYDAYGSTSALPVTKILDKLKEDSKSKTGGHAPSITH